LVLFMNNKNLLFNVIMLSTIVCNLHTDSFAGPETMNYVNSTNNYRLFQRNGNKLIKSSQEDNNTSQNYSQDVNTLIDDLQDGDDSQNDISTNYSQDGDILTSSLQDNDISMNFQQNNNVQTNYQQYNNVQYVDINSVINSIAEDSRQNKKFTITDENKNKIQQYLYGILNGMLLVENIEQYKDQYDKICEVFYKIWLIQRNKNQEISFYQNVWDTTSQNYLTVANIWETVFMQFKESIADKLLHIIKDNNVKKLKNITDNSNTNQNNKSRNFRKQLSNRNAEKNTSKTYINNVVEEEILKLSDIRCLVFYYKNKIEQTRYDVSQAKTVEVQEIENVNEYLNDIANIEDYEITKWARTKIKNEEDEEIRQQRKMSEQSRILSDDEKLSINNKWNDNMGNIESLLTEMCNTNNRKMLQKIYIQICKKCYNLWKQIKMPDGDTEDINGIWAQNDLEYKYVQELWTEISSIYQKQLDKIKEQNKSKVLTRESLRQLFSVPEIEDIRHLIQYYIKKKKYLTNSIKPLFKTIINTQKYNDNYNKLCSFFYSMWEKYAILEYDELIRPIIEQKDELVNQKIDLIINLINEDINRIWKNSDDIYTMIQEIWQNIYSEYQKEIVKTLGKIYPGNNQKINDTITKFSDIRYLIRDKIIELMKNKQMNNAISI